MRPWKRSFFAPAGHSISASDGGRLDPLQPLLARLLRLEIIDSTAQMPATKPTNTSSGISSCSRSGRTDHGIAPVAQRSVSARPITPSRPVDRELSISDSDCELTTDSGYTLMFTIFLITQRPEHLQRRWRRRSS